jgi:hypothetical protein
MKRLRVTDEQLRAARIELQAMNAAGLRPDPLVRAMANAEPMHTEEIEALQQEPLPLPIPIPDTKHAYMVSSYAVGLKLQPTGDVDVLPAVTPAYVGQAGGGRYDRLLQHTKRLMERLDNDERPAGDVELRKLLDELEADLAELERVEQR